MSKVGISTCSSSVPVRSIIPPPVPPRPNKTLVAEALAKAMQDNKSSNPRPIPGKKPNVLEYKTSRITRSPSNEKIKIPAGGVNVFSNRQTPSPPDNFSYKNVVYGSVEEKGTFEKAEKPISRVQFSEEHIYEDLMDVNGKNSPTHHHHPDIIPFSVSPDNHIKVTHAVNKELQQLGKIGNRFVLTNQNRDDKQKFNRAVPLVLPTGQHMHSDVLYPSQQIDNNSLENLSVINSLKGNAKESFADPRKETFPLVENLIVELKESSQKRSQREQNNNYPSDHAFDSNINLSKENIPSPVEEVLDFQPNIRHSDWFEVEVDGNGNGSAKAVRYSTCQITVEDLPVSSNNNSNCNSFDSRASRHRKKPRVIHNMASLQGLPPLPKSLSGFNLFESGSNIYASTSDQQQQQQQHAPPLPPPNLASRAGISRSRVHPNTTPPPPPPHHLRPQQNGMPRDPKSPIVDSRKPTFLDAQLALLRKEMLVREELKILQKMEELLNVLVLGEFSDDDVEDAILMHLLTTGENRHVDKRYGRLDFDNLTEEESFDLFRFGKEDIKQLTNLLGIDNVKTDVRCNLTGLESMCILLRRLAYPNRLVDLERVFGRSRSTISSVCNTLLLSLYQHVRPSLVDLRNVPWLTRERLQLYSDAISEKGAPLPDCWGFLDGTARAICRPKVNQREYFSGHKRAHCLKYQSVMCPDGIIVHLGGPYAGRRHDSGMLHESGFYGQLEEKTIFPDKSFVLYADQGYPLRELVITPYHRIMDDRQKLFNELMSSVRECVEWGFGKVANEFAFVDFHKNQKIGWQLVPEQYFIAVFLANCHTCLYGSITGQYFNLSPPSLEEYIAGVLKNKL